MGFAMRVLSIPDFLWNFSVVLYCSVFFKINISKYGYVAILLLLFMSLFV